VVFEKDGFKADLTAYKVFIDGEEVNLSPKEYDLLFFLIRNKNIAVPREKIMTEVWGFTYYGDALTAVQKDDSILLHIPFDSIIGWKKRLLAFSIYFFKKIENGAYDYTAGVIKSDLEKAKYIRF
jgi:hypothetical protein